MNSEKYKQYLLNQVKKRPYWCISRQRCWGVPVPVFFDKGTDKPIINNDTIEHLCGLIDERGTDFWWCLPLKDLLPQNVLDKCNVSLENVLQGQDILDIWFDSGISWSSVLGDNTVADMYLEGVDQFTGWFQSSLLTSLALRGKVPYKAIYVHGFVVDKDGLKMSKSIGNVVDPQEILEGSKKIAPYGVDVLRWWVACHANKDTLAHISDNVLQSCKEEVHKVRSILRFALAALQDYEPTDICYDNLRIIDKYILFMISSFHKEAVNNLNEYNFNKICLLVLHFLTNTISALYYTEIKDRLYCDNEDSMQRKSAQYVLEQIFFIVTRSVASIVPHLVEELYMNLPNKKYKSYFQIEEVRIPRSWDSLEVNNLMKHLLAIKKEVNKTCGASTLDKRVTVSVSEEVYSLLHNVQKFSDSIPQELADMYQVCQVDVIKCEKLSGNVFELIIQNTNNKLCPRCRRFSSLIEDELCHRCDLLVEDVQTDKSLSSM